MAAWTRTQSAPSSVQEREIIRVVATIEGHDTDAAVALAQREVLKWAQKRAGATLPRDAWMGASFEVLAGGRTTLGIDIETEQASIWALRGDDPDKTVARRIWTTEVTIGRFPDAPPKLGVRLIVSTPETSLQIDPAVPGVVEQIAKICGLTVGGFKLSITPDCPTSELNVHSVIDCIEDKKRRLPYIIVSPDERQSFRSRPHIDVNRLTRATIGLAHVSIVSPEMTYIFSDRVGKLRSVFHGGVRIYYPGFDSSSNPYEHNLFLGERVYADPSACEGTLRRIVAHESLRRARLGSDIVPFGSLRSISSRLIQETVAHSGSNLRGELDAAQNRIDALEKELLEARSSAQQSDELAFGEEERANHAEGRLRAALTRIQALEATLKSRSEPLDELSLPADWPEFADWCDTNFTGRLVLTPIARRGVRNPEYRDIAQAARAISWLATTCRDTRMNGGMSLSNISIGNGLENAPCGGDTFEFYYQGRRVTANFHVKSGGNTRDPLRCLRIYYGFDDINQEIVIAEMPAHRHTDAS